VAREAQLAGDLGLADADGEQLGGAKPAGLEPFALSLCRSAARNRRHLPPPAAEAC